MAHWESDSDGPPPLVDSSDDPDGVLVFNTFLSPVLRGDVKTVASLLRQGESPNQCRPSGLSVLEYAVKQGYLMIVRLLLAYGGDISDKLESDDSDTDDEDHAVPRGTHEKRLLRESLPWFDYLQSLTPDDAVLGPPIQSLLRLLRACPTSFKTDSLWSWELLKDFQLALGSEQSGRAKEKLRQLCLCFLRMGMPKEPGDNILGFILLEEISLCLDSHFTETPVFWSEDWGAYLTRFFEEFGLHPQEDESVRYKILTRSGRNYSLMDQTVPHRSDFPLIVRMPSLGHVTLHQAEEATLKTKTQRQVPPKVEHKESKELPSSASQKCMSIAWNEHWGTQLEQILADHDCEVERDEGTRYKIEKRDGRSFSLTDEGVPGQSDFPLRVTINMFRLDASPARAVNATGVISAEAPHDIVTDLSLSVFQEVIHDEPAAQIHPEEAKLIAAEVEVGYVERQLCGEQNLCHEAMLHDMALSEGPDLVDKELIKEFEDIDWEEDSVCNVNVPESSFSRLVLLNFTRHPPSFMKAFEEGDLLRECREDLQRAGFSYLLPCRAKVLVSPVEFNTVKRAVVGKKLGASHVITSEQLEPLVMAAVNNATTHRDNVRIKDVQLLAYVDNNIEVLVNRTFLTVPMLKQMSHSVANSTTAAPGHGNFNPRCFASSAFDDI